MAQIPASAPTVLFSDPSQNRPVFRAFSILARLLMAVVGVGLLTVGFLLSHQVLMYSLKFVENPKDTPFYNELADVSEQFVGSIITLRANFQKRPKAGIATPKSEVRTSLSKEPVDLEPPAEPAGDFNAEELRKNVLGEDVSEIGSPAPESALQTDANAPLGQRIEYRPPESDFSFVAGKPVYFFLGTIFAISILSICVRLLLGLLSAGTALLVASIRTSLHVSYVPVDED